MGSIHLKLIEVKLKCSPIVFLPIIRRNLANPKKKLIHLWQDSQTQWSESQKKLIYAWLDTVRSGATPLSPSENIAKILEFQRELINSSLHTQQVATHLVLESQKQFWDSYFQMAQKITSVNTP